MQRTFAGVVEDIRQLSFDEKIDLKDILENDLIEARREQILENAKAGMLEYERGELKGYTDIDELMKDLND